MKSLTICLTTLEVERRLNTLGISCTFSPAEHDAFATTPLVNAAGRVFGFPTPSNNETLSLEHLKASLGTDPTRQPCFFEHPWYRDEKFMRTTCPAGWHFLSMDVLPETIQQPANYLDSSNVPGVGLPLAVEVVLMLFLHYAGTGEQLLLKKHSWCSDIASLGRRVTVGAFGRNGLFISGHPPNFVSRGLGTCGNFELSSR
jgi:hypothetical protein